MRIFIYVLFTLVPFLSLAQESNNEKNPQNELIIIPSHPAQGFHNSYILFIPSGVSKNELTNLLVEPNNTGKLSDSISVHEQYAIHLASVSSIGNNIATELNIPLLVPIFSRPASKPLMYAHALDRDVVLEPSMELKRLDLQLLAMIRDAKKQLALRDILVRDKIFMNGFSASATFTNRFLFIHPEIVEAAAMGGFNGELMLPLKKYENQKLNYPLGVHDFKLLFGNQFDQKTYAKIPQHIYMGALDANDAVQFEDAYSLEERQIINSALGDNVQDRYVKCQGIYVQNNISAVFQTYPEVGHWTTSKMNLDTILFFLNISKNQ